MDNNIRLQYLQAMGVAVWVPRQALLLGGGMQMMATMHDHSVSEVDAWQVLQAEVSACERCDLCQTRTQTVFGTGDVNAEWLFIGEAPGQNEDEMGKPFVGQAGKLLTEMMRAMGLQRESVYITNILKCRPPNNRDPKVNEVEHCLPYLQQQIRLLNPKVIIVVGRIAAQTLLTTKDSLSRLRGRVHDFQGVPLVVIYHPAYLLRSLLEKRKAWQDLQLAMKVYQEL